MLYYSTLYIARGRAQRLAVGSAARAHAPAEGELVAHGLQHPLQVAEARGLPDHVGALDLGVLAEGAREVVLEVVLYYAIICYTTLYDSTLYHSILYHTILYYIVQYYTVLYHTILYYTIPYHTTL